MTVFQRKQFRKKPFFPRIPFLEQSMRKILLPKAVPCWPTSLRTATMSIDELGTSQGPSKMDHAHPVLRMDTSFSFYTICQHQWIEWFSAIQKTTFPQAFPHPMAWNSMDSFKRWICCMQSRPNFWRFSFWSCFKGGVLFEPYFRLEDQLPQVKGLGILRFPMRVTKAQDQRMWIAFVSKLHPQKVHWKHRVWHGSNCYTPYK